MKLKYYMRGLGIGILLTALILSIGVKKEKLSDQEIIDKASKLGMVMAQEQELGEMLAATATPEPPEDTESVPEVTMAPDSGDDPADTEQTGTEIGDTEPADTEPADTETADGNGEEPEVTAAPDPADTDDTVDTDQADEAEDTGELGGTITFTVVKGMSSGKVAKLLQEKGLIEDADDFNSFIMEAGKAGVIRIGTYSLPKDVSYQTIMDTITN